MTAHALIEEARADGLELRLNGERLRLSGPAEVVERWKPRIVASKPEIMAALQSASRWWLLHYPDREPVEVAFFPDATHAEILERHPDALAAEPINQATPEPAHTSCKTCTHVTGRGGCGEPVAAGLSDVVGVIRYSHNHGATCQAWRNTHD